MLYIMKKEIDVDNSKIIFQDDFSNEDLSKKWDIASGNWNVSEGWLVGKNLDNSGGMIYSKESFNANILMDFEGKTVPPCRNDLNFTWCSEGWDNTTNDAGISYIAGLQGWWEEKVGIERYPECKIRSLTPTLEFNAGQIYHIQAGSIDGHCFIFVDGKLIIEVFDPEPIDTSKYGKFGFGTYASHTQIRNLKVYEINWKNRESRYIPNF